jgi:large subunit ribosomal protein L3
LKIQVFTKRKVNMISTLIGKKLDQEQTFLENGNRVPVSKILLADNVVLQAKTLATDSYAAVQLGAGSKKKANKAYLGHVKKQGAETAPLKIKEVRLGNVQEEDMPKSGDLLSVDSVFKPGDIVEVSGTSKGKGFAGGVKRHGFRGGPKTHGQSDRHRAPGSIGQGTTPGRVYKGKRMAGRMGTETVTVTNLRVVDVDTEEKMLYVSGLVPGHKNSWVYITKTGEDKNFVPPIDKKEKKVEQVEVEPEQQVAADENVALGADAEAKVDAGVEEAVVKDATEAVETPAETVKTAEETVQTVEESVQTPVESVSDETKSKNDDAAVASDGEEKAPEGEVKKEES